MKSRDEEANELKAMEPELRQALGDFKLSVGAWSEAMMGRPREAKAPARINWSAVTKWALGCTVFVGTVSGGLYQNHKQVEAARVETARVAAQQRSLESAKAAKVDEEELMADVDSDVSRQVPSALEPMASMMAADETKGN